MDESKQLNKDIFETIYCAVRTSMEIAEKEGRYETFGSPASKGIYNLIWNVQPSNRYNWTELKEKIKTHGLRNFTSCSYANSIYISNLGNNECFEPFTSNIYVRRTLAGEFVIVNKYLIRELINDYEWNEDIKNSIVKNNGSFNI